MSKFKLKTRRGTAKRIKVTATGKLLRRRANGTHFLAKKSNSRKRVIGTTARVRGAIAGNLRRALGGKS
jgi:large subunit ribosomal protein L35